MSVRVVASDLVSQTGVRAQLRGRPDVWVLDEGGANSSADVTVVVCDDVDTAAVRVMREARCDGRTGVVLVATRLDDASLLTAVEAGAGAIVPRCEASPERLTSAVNAVAEGRGDVPADLLGRLLGQVGNLQRTVLANYGLNAAGLAEREVQILRLVADGCDTAEIASSLAYSERTVKNVIHDITTRLQLRNRSHAVAYAVRQGLI